MVSKFHIKSLALESKFIAILFLISATCVSVTILLDYLYAFFQNTSFYFSESFLFSSFWWVFIPFLMGQYILVHTYQSKFSGLWYIVIPLLLHLFFYPALIWTISKLFYENTFDYWQTLTFELTTYSFILIFFYTVPFLFLFKNKLEKKAHPSLPHLPNNENTKKKITSILVSEGNKKIMINVDHILYISANSPYINIYLERKKYVHHETLKSISEQLAFEKFVRIHKSTIVNILKVHYYKSRLNGDYDITLFEGTELRLSRNYASNFMLMFKEKHQDTTKYHPLS